MDIKNFYKDQILFQNEVIKRFGYKELNKDDKLPIDNVSVSSYHLLALAEEVGELIKSDKRWKNFRNTHFDKQNKLEEIADCFIVLMNVCIFSGISADEFEESIMKKIKENFERISL